jgi:hypothetical protein
MPSQSFDEAALKADFTKLPKGAKRGPADRWSAELVGPLQVDVTMSPEQHPDESFLAQLVWDRYPDAAPSVLFKDPETGSSQVPHAWPTGGPFRPVTGLCVNYTREGFALHPEWVNDARFRWHTHGNVLLKVIRLLQDDLDVHYAGRQQ